MNIKPGISTKTLERIFFYINKPLGIAYHR